MHKQFALVILVIYYDSTNFQVGNHDNSRTATRYGPALVDGINMIVLLLPGVGVTYMVNIIKI